MNVWKQFSGSMRSVLIAAVVLGTLPFTPCNCPAQEPTANDWQQGIKLLLESLNHADAGRAKECTAAAEEFSDHLRRRFPPRFHFVGLYPEGKALELQKSSATLWTVTSNFSKRRKKSSREQKRSEY